MKSVQKYEDKTDSFGADAVCLQVFSMITASISHEVKNVLAIINENGGLLEDLVMMGGSDQGVASEHIKSATATISSQVQRANLIMKNCNRFAHLVDKPVGREPLSEILELMAALAGRQAAMKNITLFTKCPAEMQVTASMLPQASLVYLLLRTMIDVGKSDSAITVSAETVQNGVTLYFTADLAESEFVQIAEISEISHLVQHLDGLVRNSDGELQILMP